ncbi:MAG TPA: N-acetylmuramic acid 6-phosphate etherase [Candidatus Ruania gallistercoris]|uniref:N-acetylmuramic acid 6-phosphate etherase n=1 Tax=Candidatus Ruania gallistercoris TaxID=2838746 RepID=A0A9D2EC22_9MICO|nr:N-acetylmuramic acid 6-phosphate etherase [Candidatus Ruania gallistercoris]
MSVTLGGYAGVVDLEGAAEGEPVLAVQVRSPTEERNPRSTRIDMLDAAGVVATILAEDAGVAAAVAARSAEITDLVELGVAALRGGGRVLYVGAGTSGRLAVLDAAELLPTYQVGEDQVRAHIAGGAPAMLHPVEGAEDDETQGRAVVADVTARDLVIGLAASGRTPYVAGALQHARSVGARIGLIACNPAAPLAELADVAVLVDTGPEVVTGSTRMKAGTAQKMVLNTFSTAVMIRCGKTYSNLMVDVLPTNEKLRGRVLRMLTQATGAGLDRCREVLDTAGSPRTALVCLLADAPPEVAAEALATHPPDDQRSGDPSGVRSAVERLRRQRR